jgi:hypothetical protein
MGLFSGEDVFTANATAAKLFDEVANPLKQATISAILAGHDIHDYHMMAYYNSFVVQADRYLEYGEKHYIEGLPAGKIYATALDKSLVEPAIESDEGQPVTVLYSFFTEFMIDYYVYTFLQEAYNWTLGSNILSINSIIFKYVRYTTNYRPTTPTEIGNPASKIIITLQQVDLPDEEVDLIINHPGTGVYAHATYHYDSQPETAKRFWIYDPRTGKWPDIDAVLEDTVPFGGQFYPIVPIRIDGEMLSESYSPEWYESARSIFKKLELDINELQDALSGEGLPPEDEKPDMNDIDDCWFLFALDIYTLVPESAEYLFNFFSDFAAVNSGQKELYEDSKNNIYSGEDAITAAFQVTEGQFNMFLEYNYIERIDGQTGVIAEKFVNDVIYIEPTVHTYYETDDEGIQYPARNLYLINSYVSFKKRTGVDTYDEVIIHGPVHASRVNALGHTKTVIKHIREDFINAPSKAGTSGFYIPISHVTLNEVFDRVNKEIVLFDGMMLAVYAGHKEHLAWYQTGFFRILLMIAIFIISVYLMTNFGPVALSLTQAIVQVAITQIIFMMVAIAADLLIKNIGGTFGTILAIALVVAAMYFAPGSTLNFSLNTADDFLKATQVFVSAADKISGIYFQSEMAGLEEEYDSFMKNAKEQQDELDEAWDLLGPEGSPYDPLYVTQNTSMMNPNETVTQFYDRTSHTGNPGVLTLDQIENYVSNLLKLPEPDNSDYIVVH